VSLIFPLRARAAYEIRHLQKIVSRSEEATPVMYIAAKVRRRTDGSRDEVLLLPRLSKIRFKRSDIRIYPRSLGSSLACRLAFPRTFRCTGRSEPFKLKDQIAQPLAAHHPRSPRNQTSRSNEGFLWRFGTIVQYAAPQRPNLMIKSTSWRYLWSLH